MSVVSGAVNGSGVGVLSVGAFDDGDVVVLTVWGQDRAGNNGSSVTVSWRVDVSFPASTWESARNVVWSQPSVDAMFTCPKPGCVVMYSLDGGALNTVTPATSGSASNDSGAMLVLSNGVDVVLQEVPCFWHTKQRARPREKVRFCSCSTRELTQGTQYGYPVTARPPPI